MDDLSNFLFDKTLKKDEHIQLPEKIDFLLIGGGDLAKYTLQYLTPLFNRVYLVSNLEWDEAWSMQNKTSIFQVSKELGIEYINAEDYTKAKEFIFEKKPNLCLTIGSKWIFKADILDFFNGLIFNYHPTNLPKYRGGGGFSWQVLNGETKTYTTIHQMVSKIDAGKIVIKREMKVNANPIPQDFFKATFSLAQETIISFLKILEKNDVLQLYTQNNNESSYFPLLKSSINGALNWDWEIEDLEKFIRAFSYPYPGSFTYYNDEKINILEAKIENKQSFHPFCVGLITSINENNGVNVICKNGILNISKISFKDKEIFPETILKVGNRLYTPKNLLEEGILYRP